MRILGHFRLNPYWNQESCSNLSDHFLDHILDRESYFLDVKMKSGALNELFKSNPEAILDWRPRNGLMAAKTWQKSTFCYKNTLTGRNVVHLGQKFFFLQKIIFFSFSTLLIQNRLGVILWNGPNSCQTTYNVFILISLGSFMVRV